MHENMTANIDKGNTDNIYTKRITKREAVTGGSTTDTNLSDVTGEAKLNIIYTKQEIIKIKQEVQPLRLRHVGLTWDRREQKDVGT